MRSPTGTAMGPSPWGAPLYARQMDFPRNGYAAHSPSADWPFGDTYRSNADLPGHLHEIGHRHAQRALRLYSSEDTFEQLDAAVSMGSAVELLAKSLLASVNTILLLPVNADVPAMLKYSGTRAAEVENPDAFQVKSLDASKAIDRLRHLRLLPVWTTSDHSVFSVRNAAVHMGVVQQNLLRSAVHSMVRFAEHARIRSGQSAELWWGDELAPIAESMVEADTVAWAQIVQAKMAAARIRVAEIKAGLPELMVDAILASMTGPWRVSMEHNETTECPACGYTGWATGTVDRGAGETQYEDDGWPTFYSVLNIQHFECNVCGLKLTDEAELEIAEVEAALEFPDEEFFPEPDI